MHYRPLDWTVTEWLNVPVSFDVRQLEGRVILAAAFQMLCPSCVEHTIPQLKRAAALFSPDQVAVVGLHTVFEHHESMSPSALRAFLHEYKVAFPVAVDAPGEGAVPTTMATYQMQGTPTVLIYGRDGRQRRQVFGHMPDMHLAAEVVNLIHEAAAGPGGSADGDHLDDHACGPDGCPVPYPPADASDRPAN